MKFYPLMLLVTLSTHNLLLPMQHPAQQQLQRKTSKTQLTPPLTWHSSLTNNPPSYVPNELLNTILSDSVQNLQWWYLVTIKENKKETIQEISFSHKNDGVACVLEQKIHIFDLYSNKWKKELSYRIDNEICNIISLNMYSLKKVAILYQKALSHHNPHCTLEIKDNTKKIYLKGTIAFLSWNPSGELITMSDGEGNSQIYQMNLNEETQATTYNSIGNVTSYLRYLKADLVSPLDTYIACITTLQIHLLNIKQKTLCFSYFYPNYSSIRSLVFNHDETLFSCAFFDKTIQTFDLTHITNPPIPISIFNAKNVVQKLFYNDKNELMGWYLTPDENRINAINTATNITTTLFSINHLPSPIAYTDEFPFSTPLVDLCSQNRHCVLGLKNGTIYLFKRHYNPTIEQLLLRKILQVWCLIEKPSKTVTTIENLLQKIITLFSLNKHKIAKTWNSFPEYMQQAIWFNMHRLITTYGK